MNPDGLYSKLIYHDDAIYKGCIGSRFILVHKSVLVIMEDCIRDNEQGL